MPRTQRLDPPGALQHVMVRGIEGRVIFNSDRDREDLVSRLSDLLPQTGTDCLAWSFLPNHAHFLFRAGPSGITRLMRRLLTGYAVSFNLRHERQGHLFQNRYKSIVCEEEPYFFQLLRYIHLNPIRAGIVSNLDGLNRFPYCGHGAVMGTVIREWQDVRSVIELFGGTPVEAREAYLSYVEKGIAMGERHDLTGGGLLRSFGGWDGVKSERRSGTNSVEGDERILGSSAFVKKMLAKSDTPLKETHRRTTEDGGLTELATKVADLFGLGVEEVIRRGKHRRRSEARSLLCFWAVDKLEMKQVDVAEALRMTTAGVGYAVSRGRSLAEERGYTLPGEGEEPL